jgi:transcriptional regulator
MLIHPWDAALDDGEWRAWLDDGHDFGQLIASGADGWPLVVPTHFCRGEADELLVHLARPNPVWPLVERDPRVTLSVVDDYAFIPTAWRAPQGTPPEQGVPTSYYAAVVLRCQAELVDDPDQKAALLRRQLAHFQPAGSYAEVAVGEAPYGRLLSGIRGLRLHVVGVSVKFKYDDHKPHEHRTAVAAQLQQRALGRDLAARGQQLRRLRHTAATEAPWGGTG